MKRRRKPVNIDAITDGWHIKEGSVFKDEFDIRYTPRKSKGKLTMKWTQGDPPLYSFTIGHVFHSPDGLIAQIDSAISDTFKEDKGKVAGLVTFSLWHKGNPAPEKIKSATVTQDNFVHFLKTGEIRPMPRIHPEFF